MNVLRSPTGSDIVGGVVGRSDSQPNLAIKSSEPEFEQVETNRRYKRKKPEDENLIHTELSEMRKQMTEMMNMLTLLTTSQTEFTQKISSDITTIKDQFLQMKSITDNLVIEQEVIKSDLSTLRQSGIATEQKVNDIGQTIEQLNANTIANHHSHLVIYKKISSWSLMSVSLEAEIL